MSKHSVAEAKNKLPELIACAEKGEEIIITRHGRDVVIVLALGNASYALYLLHPLFFAVFLQMKPGPTLQRIELMAGLGLATVAFSWVFYRLVEAPLIRLLRRRLAHDPPPAVQA